MVRQFHKPVDVTLVLKALAVLPTDVKRQVIASLFAGVSTDAQTVKRYCDLTAPKQMKYAPAGMSSCVQFDLIPFILNKDEKELELVFIYPVERRWMHDWCDALNLDHFSYTEPDPEKLEVPGFDTILVIRKPAGWAFNKLIMPVRKN